jgi:hypothetical protein
MANQYNVHVVNVRGGSVVEESGPFATEAEAISVAREYAASDRDEKATGLGYEVVAPESASLSQIVYWTAHSGDGVVDEGVGQPPWAE